MFCNQEQRLHRGLSISGAVEKKRNPKKELTGIPHITPEQRAFGTTARQYDDRNLSLDGEAP
jgi:hypothetical protein